MSAIAKPRRTNRTAKVTPLYLAPSVSAGNEIRTSGDTTAARHNPWDYHVDFWQRGILLLDTLRQRANNALAHEQAGLPPLLNFAHETILDARTFDHPANYALLKIVGYGVDTLEMRFDDTLPPVMIVDPRAGHGPGIGGFKRDSEVGMALHLGHPVYFVVFFPEPCPKQTLADVHHALRRFVEEVGRRHQGKSPVLYGNCQAGWAMTLLSADCEGLVGPTVLNGSPLSYWAGASAVNPMRLSGGLVGGTWLVHFLSDLGNGRFDGAWLVQNFENLNPANSLWEKYYKLFDRIDAEQDRFLEFERWWGGFYFLSREEIVAIVENLFVGNRLEQGEMRICEHCIADLKRIRNPLLIFASSGDNITPPHQALNWIPTLYPTTQKLKEAKQRIVYLLNTHVGHLGIFVSADVARLEHRAILENLAALEDLPPGLYEMKIAAATAQSGDRYAVTFEERQVEEIRFEYRRQEFENVERLSEYNEAAYAALVSPWVRAAANPFAASLLKWWHPMRVSRYVFSEKCVPWMAVIAPMAQAVREQRKPCGDDHALRALEHAMSKQVTIALDTYRQLRDIGQEWLFQALYGR